MNRGAKRLDVEVPLALERLALTSEDRVGQNLRNKRVQTAEPADLAAGEEQTFSCSFAVPDHDVLAKANVNLRATESHGMFSTTPGLRLRWSILARVSTAGVDVTQDQGNRCRIVTIVL